MFKPTTRCTMVAKGIQGTGTSAQTERERKREAETPVEENAKQSEVNAGEETCGGNLRAPSLHKVRSATGAAPFRALPIWASSSDPGNGAQLSGGRFVLPAELKFSRFTIFQVMWPGTESVVRYSFIKIG